MNICIIYVLYGGLTMGTPACQAQLFHGDGVITPHEVVYTSHVPDCWEGYVYHVPKYRVKYYGPNIRVKRYHRIIRHHNHRVRYYKHKKFSKRKRFKPRKYHKRHKKLYKRHYKK